MRRRFAVALLVVVAILAAPAATCEIDWDLYNLCFYGWEQPFDICLDLATSHCPPEP